MKLFIIICVFAAIACPCVRAKSFNFANFFLGTKDSDSDSATASHSPSSETGPQFIESERIEDGTEIDPLLFNSSEETLMEFEYQNSSSEGLEISNHNESKNIPPSTSSTTTAKPQINESHSSDNNEVSTSGSTVATKGKFTSEETSTTVNTSTISTEPDEQEEVVLGTTTATAAVLIPRTIFQKSIEWVEDAYTLSILIPIAAGVLFATAIIATIAFCRCLRRCCRRRKFKRKALPDSVKNLRPSDRARLLGESSDEEF
ncbi:uncharacterized protein TNIN_311541 [Trichonephila inaurata madagascariensis]|uniref:Uncharacterized protein n=1 Tax=Trichonephila inaurata madagascariensis TaxID=2747483 RepID=A0A8X6MKI2_9ARAC|nr:uncharacterized protein TNIN_311541 [Trichonephila inaurata madagascariensis]